MKWYRNMQMTSYKEWIWKLFNSCYLWTIPRTTMIDRKPCHAKHRKSQQLFHLQKERQAWCIIIFIFEAKKLMIVLLHDWCEYNKHSHCWERTRVGPLNRLVLFHGITTTEKNVWNHDSPRHVSSIWLFFLSHGHDWWGNQPSKVRSRVGHFIQQK